MKQLPSESVLRWVADVVGPDAKVVVERGLRDDANPWWLRVEREGTVRDLVLRVGNSRSAPALATVAAALRFAAEQGLPAPRLVAADPGGEDAGAPATLETALPGNSELPGTVSAARLREAGAAIAKVHAIGLAPRPDLPLRTRPTQVDDRALEGRWATLYQAAADSEKGAVVDALRELTGWSTDEARAVAAGPRSTPLLQLADERVRELGRPTGETVFVHGDVWGGNMRWEGDTCTALIDWRCAGAGDPGVDLGELRMQMAHQYDLEAADHVLDGWQRETGRPATHVAYWDAVAALNTPADMAGWPAFDNQGRPVGQSVVIARRDAFLRSALDRL